MHAMYITATETQTAALQRGCSERCAGFLPQFMCCTLYRTGQTAASLVALLILAGPKKPGLKDILMPDAA